MYLLFNLFNCNNLFIHSFLFIFYVFIHSCLFILLLIILFIFINFIHIYSSFMHLVNKHAPMRKIREKAQNNPWFIPELARLLQDRNLAWAKDRRTKSDSGAGADWPSGEPGQFPVAWQPIWSATLLFIFLFFCCCFCLPNVY